MNSRNFATKVAKLLSFGNEIKKNVFCFAFLSLIRNFVAMKQLTTLIRQYPLSTTLIILIWILCLTPWIPETPLDDVSLIDKWTHLVMYGVLTATIWWEGRHRRNTKNAKRWYLLAFLGPVAMGGLVELAQAYLTAGHRSGDWLDFAANSLGVCLGTVVGYSCSMVSRHRQKG